MGHARPQPTSSGSNTLKKLTDAGEIPYWFITPGGRYMYARETLEEHMRQAARRNSGGAS